MEDLKELQKEVVGKLNLSKIEDKISRNRLGYVLRKSTNTIFNEKELDILIDYALGIVEELETLKELRKI